MTLKTLLILPLLLTLAIPVLADDDKALLAECDIDRNGVINGPTNDMPPAAWAMVSKERGCMREYNLDQLAKDIPDIRKRCDLNGNGRIDHPAPLIEPILMSGTETNGKKAFLSLPEEVRNQVVVEQKCLLDASIAQKDASIAKKDASIAKNRAEIAKDKAEIDENRAKIAKKTASIAKLDEDYAKMFQILAMLNPAEAKTELAKLSKEIEQMERQLAKEKNQTTVKSLEYKLGYLRAQLKALKNRI